MNPPIVCAHDLSFGYDQDLVLKDVNFDVYPGDFLSIIGPNGGGKSTLLKLILGLVRPTSGQLEVFGRLPVKSRKKIGYVPQYVGFDPQFPVTSIEVVLMGRLDRSFWGWYTAHDKESALNSLRQVGLSDLAHRPFSELSGGQRQRVLIARALATEAPLLIMDEPTNNVDQASQAGLFEVLRDLTDGRTILLVSHDMDVVSSLTKRVLCLNKTAVLHDTQTLEPQMLVKLFSNQLSLVRHDHKLEGGHSHE